MFPHFLKAFCDKTVAIIKTYQLLNIEDTGETIAFIEEVLKFCKMISTKEMHEDVKTNDPL